jgi:dolichol-phosphate mannosyltransferase
MPEYSIVVPTYSEAENVREVYARLKNRLGSGDWELIFVDDDSPDHTADIVRDLAQQDRRVRCIQRIGRRGLSTAVVEGALSSSSPIIAVMDADLQHDEAIVPDMIRRLVADDLDVVVGSRYVAGGSTGDWNSTRKSVSSFATRLSRGLVPDELRDPMSGFFVVKTAVLRGVVKRLSGYGYKILVDMFASSSRPLRFAEVAYTFRERTHGQSKLDSLVVWEYLMLLLDKRIGHVISPRLVFFIIVGGSGVGIHFALLSLLYLGLGAYFGAAQAAATGVAMTSNFFLNNLFTYRDKRLRGWPLVKGLLSFYAVCGLGALANIGVAAYAFFNNVEWALSAFAGIVVGTLWNYLATARYTWGARRS